MKLTEVFDDLSIYRQVRNVKELDSRKTYLVEVEVGDKSKADTLAMMKQAKSIFDAKGITNVMYVPVVNDKAILNVKEMTQNQIKGVIDLLYSYLGKQKTLDTYDVVNGAWRETADDQEDWDGK